MGDEALRSLNNSAMAFAMLFKSDRDRATCLILILRQAFNPIFLGTLSIYSFSQSDATIVLLACNTKR